MADITLNSAVRSNLRTLQSTTDLMNRTEERLSTGKKVNSAFDNPASYFTSQSLDRRASDLSGLLDSVSSSTKALQAADNGIKAINDVVEGLKATARSALQSQSGIKTKSFTESADVANLTEANLIGGTPSAVTNATLTGTGGFSSSSTLGGSPAAITIQAAGLNGGSAVSVSTLASGDTAAAAATKIQAALDAATGGNGGLTVSGSSGQLVFTNTSGNNVTLAGDSTTLGSMGFASGNRVSSNGAVAGATLTGSNEGKTLTVKDRSGADKTVTLAASGVNTLDELNKFFEDNDVALSASVSTSGSNGKLKIEAANSAAGDTPTALAGSLTTSGGAFNGKTFSAPVPDADAKAKRAAFVEDYNDALKQINTLAKDASFNGVNLLNGDDLDIVFNEDGSSKLNVQGVEFDANGIGLSDISIDNFLDSDSINSVIDTIDSAFSTLEAQSSKFGSQLQIVQTRQSFTKDMIGTLEDGSNALTAADTNAEAANLATLQTRQSLIVSALSISTSQEQNVLQLLR